MLRKFLDSLEPLFHKGGKLEKLYPLYEANDTILYTPGDVTDKVTHVRDAIDTKRMMVLVVVALIPCIFMAMYNTGYQANKIIESGLGGTDSVWQAPISGWRYQVMDMVGVDYRTAGDFYNNWKHPGILLSCLFHGALYFLPVYIVTMAAGGTCEVLFSVIRRHEVNEGFLVTGMLFPLTLPPNIPLWQVAIGIVFGVVIGKEIFGGTGRNFLNPALTARAFLYFSYAKEMTGESIWTAVDGFSGATPLGAVARKGTDTVANVVGGLAGEVTHVNGEPIEAIGVQVGNVNWWDAFWGNMHGSMGETSVFCCLLGAIFLIATRIGSWRIMAGVLIGMVSFSWLLTLFTDETVYNLGPSWNLVLGGFAFGTVFMATDPVSASMTNTGKWIYGGLIGFITVMVRSVNPAFPEGIMLAILFANVFAPLIDYFVVQANIKRRLVRNAA